MKFQPTHIVIFALVVLSSFTVANKSQQVAEIHLLTKESVFEAGQDIILRFSTKTAIQPSLYCTNSYGSTLLKPVLTDHVLSYTFPKHIANKKGVVFWELTYDGKNLVGQFIIEAKLNVSSLETYIGPPSIQAGGSDFSMLVVIPTDELDNPLPNQTNINAKYQFLNHETNDTINTNHLIAYKNIYSQNESGRMLVSSDCLGFDSKEFTVNVLPAIPTDFTITATQPHQYADGNQLTTFETSILVDQNNNIVSDGTFVNFIITNEKGTVLKTYGTTINGVATAKMIHPDNETQWDVKAFVTGMAESNVIRLIFKQAVKDFEVEFSENNRTIEVGPLKSFMGQMIPDGLVVELKLYKSEVFIASIEKTSFEGFAEFKLNPAHIKNDEYSFRIQVAGLEKTFIKRTQW